MAPLIVLIVTTIIFWLVGLLGVGVWSGFALALTWGLACMFLFTALSHFTPMRKDLIRTIPAGFPNPAFLVFISGILEALGALGLLLGETRKAAAICLILLLLAVFPANIKAAREKLTYRGKVAPPLWFRVPLQILFIASLIVVIVLA
jgi:uncharacterized membrane protein